MPDAKALDGLTVPQALDLLREGGTEEGYATLRGLLVRELLVARAGSEGVMLSLPRPGDGTPFRMPADCLPTDEAESFLERTPESFRLDRAWFSGGNGRHRIRGVPRGWSAFAVVEEYGVSALGHVVPLHGTLHMLSPEARMSVFDFQSLPGRTSFFPARIRVGRNGCPEMVIPGRAVSCWPPQCSERLCSRSGLMFAAGLSLVVEGEGRDREFWDMTLNSGLFSSSPRGSRPARLARANGQRLWGNESAWNFVVPVSAHTRERRLQAVGHRPYLRPLLEQGCLPRTLAAIDEGRPFLSSLAEEVGIPPSLAAVAWPGMPTGVSDWFARTLRCPESLRLLCRLWSRLSHLRSSGNGGEALSRLHGAGSFLLAHAPSPRSSPEDERDGEDEEDFERLVDDLVADLPRNARNEADGRAAFATLDSAMSVAHALAAAARAPMFCNPSAARAAVVACRLFRGRRRVTWSGILDASARWHGDDVRAFLSARSVQLLEGLGSAPSPTGAEVEELPGGTARWLLSPRDLAREGEEMRHCVASYAGSVLSAHSVIASLRAADGTRGTVEIERRGEGWGVRQVSAEENKTPSPAVLALAEGLVALMGNPSEAFLDFLRARAGAPDVDDEPAAFVAGREGDPEAAMDFLRRFGLVHPRLRGMSAGELADWSGLTSAGARAARPASGRG